MTERITLPPKWCANICRNSMNQICVESCAIKRDTSAFEPTPNLKLIDMPKFPNTKGMTKEEKFTSVVIYLAKITEHLQGVDNEPIPFRRQDIYTETGGRISPVIPIQDLLHAAKESVTVVEDREEQKNPGIPTETVVSTTD